MLIYTEQLQLSLNKCRPTTIRPMAMFWTRVLWKNQHSFLLFLLQGFKLSTTNSFRSVYLEVFWQLKKREVSRATMTTSAAAVTAGNKNPNARCSYSQWEEATKMTATSRGVDSEFKRSNSKENKPIRTKQQKPSWYLRGNQHLFEQAKQTGNRNKQQEEEDSFCFLYISPSISFLSKIQISIFSFEIILKLLKEIFSSSLCLSVCV